jgi:hypothetical protein
MSAGGLVLLEITLTSLSEISMGFLDVTFLVGRVGRVFCFAPASLLGVDFFVPACPPTVPDFLLLCAAACLVLGAPIFRVTGSFRDAFFFFRDLRSSSGSASSSCDEEEENESCSAVGERWNFAAELFVFESFLR